MKIGRWKMLKEGIKECQGEFEERNRDNCKMYREIQE